MSYFQTTPHEPPPTSLDERVRLARRRRLGRTARRAFSLGTWAACGLAMAASLASLVSLLR